MPSAVVESLKGVDVDRLTPIDALTLVAKLKRLIETEDAGHRP